MLTFDEYRRYDALGLAGLVKKGDVTPSELLETAIQRANDVNPRINAIIHPIYDEARATAARVDTNAPFAGVPFLVKDLGMEVKGVPMRVGSKGYLNYVSAEDSFAVTKMRKAGLVIFGKTNAPEFGLTPYTEPKLFGPCLNPWNLGHSTGGSSGGSAAAVAAGITPIATANDGGGSIRIPASCCGLFGLKPSRGRVSWAKLYGSMWNGAAIEGCVSRSVRDSAAYLDVIRGAAPGDPYIAQAPERPYLEEVGTAPGKLRVGYTAGHTMGQVVDEACLKAMQNAVDALRSAGHTVEEVALPYYREDLTKAFLVIVAAQEAAEVDRLSQFLGRRVRPSDLEPNTYAMGILGKAYSAMQYAVAARQWEDIGYRMGHFHEQYDILLTPTLAKRPIKTGALQNTPAEDVLVKIVNTFGLSSAMKTAVDQLADKVYGYMPWTAFANITGQPSMSIPFHWTEENLPIGAMFTTRIGDEALLFRLAAQLEQLAPWMDKVPNI
jgi:amidase